MQQTTFGAHIVSFEPPDLIRVAIVGPLSLDEMRAMVAWIRSVPMEKDYLLVLADASQLGLIPAEVRKAARTALGLPLRGVAYTGASFTQKVMVRMTTATFQLFAEMPDHPSMFCNTEAEALAWLAQRRRLLDAGVAHAASAASAASAARVVSATGTRG